MQTSININGIYEVFQITNKIIIVFTTEKMKMKGDLLMQLSFVVI